MKNILVLLIGLIILLMATKFSIDYAKKGTLPFIAKTATVTINKITFSAEVANTTKKKELGLSERKSLEQNKAMLFPFEKEGYYPFWMKNMKFPIDILYLSKNKVVQIIEEAKPPRNNEAPIIYTPQEPIDAVFEINAGSSKKYNIKVGDTVTIKM